MAFLRITIFIEAILIVNFTSFAAEEFEDAVPVPVVEALFDTYGGNNFAVYSDIVDGFPSFEIPDGFEVIGSVDQTMSQRVAFTTELAEENAIDTMTAVLVAEGWQIMPIMNSFDRQRGFVGVIRPFRLPSRMLCHDDFGQLNLSFRSRNPLNLLALNTSGGLSQNLQSCAERISQTEQSIAMMEQRDMGVSQYMPILEVPSEARQGNRPAVMVGGMSSSNNSAETNATIQLDWALEEVFSHFGEQMLDQSWQSDSESSGAISATGIWTQTVNQDVTIIARLSVISSDEDRFDLQLSVEVPGGTSSGFIMRSQ